jgi:hypothetical protein
MHANGDRPAIRVHLRFHFLSPPQAPSHRSGTSWRRAASYSCLPPTRQASHTAHARAAGPGAPAIRPSQGALTPSPTVPFKPFRTDPLNREPAPKPASIAPFKPFRTDPLNREPAPKPAPTAPFKPFRTDPLNREPTLPPNPTHFTSTGAAAVPQHDVPQAPRHTRPPYHPPPAPPPPDHQPSAARHNPYAQRTVPHPPARRLPKAPPHQRPVHEANPPRPGPPRGENLRTLPNVRTPRTVTPQPPNTHRPPQPVRPDNRPHHRAQKTAVTFPPGPPSRVSRRAQPAG